MNISNQDIDKITKYLESCVFILKANKTFEGEPVPTVKKWYGRGECFKVIYDANYTATYVIVQGGKSEKYFFQNIEDGLLYGGYSNEGAFVSQECLHNWIEKAFTANNYWVPVEGKIIMVRKNERI